LHLWAISAGNINESNGTRGTHPIIGNQNDRQSISYKPLHHLHHTFARTPPQALPHCLTIALPVLLTIHLCLQDMNRARSLSKRPKIRTMPSVLLVSPLVLPTQGESHKPPPLPAVPKDRCPTINHRGSSCTLTLKKQRRRQMKMASSNSHHNTARLENRSVASMVHSQECPPSLRAHSTHKPHTLDPHTKVIPSCRICHGLPHTNLILHTVHHNEKVDFSVGTICFFIHLLHVYYMVSSPAICSPSSSYAYPWAIEVIKHNL
jgi:hypothetical protein